MKKLDVNLGEKPLWSQLYDIVSERIETGIYKVGDILPTEMQLMEEFDVSRITVRQAMDKLISENRILRRRGKGTVVLEKKDRISTVFQSTFSSLEENEINHRRVLKWKKYVKAPMQVAQFFNIAEDAMVLCIKRDGISDDGKILDTHLTYINPITEMGEGTDFTHSMYEQYRKYGFEIENVTEIITASIATKEERDEFHVDKKPVALMCRERKGFHNGIGVEFTISKYLSEGYALFINNI